MNPVPTPTDQKQPHCYSSQLKPFYHGNIQQYTSSTTGKCRGLNVQSVNPSPSNDWIEHGVRSRRMFNPSNETFMWLFVWLAYIAALLLPSWRAPRPFTFHYNPYLMRFVGQLWAARSPKEYSLRSRIGEENGRVRRITHALYPRFLMVYDRQARTWKKVNVEAVAVRKPYVAITYSYYDMTTSGGGEEVIKRRSQEATLNQGLDAYWLDLECLLEDPAQKDEDLYRMADVYRLASFTLIVLSSESAWRGYGGRIWTLPEVLLSRELLYKTGNNAVTPITLIQLASLAYEHHGEESQIINSFGLGKDPLERLDRNLQLTEAIWRRKSNSQGRYRAEKVYALMGFFEHRILPNAEETELQALARLFMANDNDRIADRMISMFPGDRAGINQWYTKEDEYGAKLWDIEPTVQAIGITSNGSLVLDGCRAAVIRWKDFPSIGYATSRSFRRAMALTEPYFAFLLFIVGCATISQGAAAGGAVLLILSIILLIFAPVMTTYGHSGRVVLACPWLIGVKGVISAQQASFYLYGGQIGDSRRTLYTPTGSPLAKPRGGDSRFREGHISQYEAALAAPPFDPMEGHMFTLVDTISGTIYYFRAHRPPTVCLFTGTEGGQGRFVMCSEECSSSELRRETVLRMPTFISNYMHACDWVAVGGKP
ncbi:uncharacterized protein EDB91DRAFT_1184439 [Suillus paluster]|uniref:uncharacterized protein n=1 Tax=Suillus paluster TaxID=48578 RepID=UPI001B880727|nr:uncharacterized protein EDB91DRAFT_1184439 [Suillus paluster]KAG1718663.1 hypothetical protein EDB91DRAFT_1184439 [Suillus paluster]